MLEICRRTRGEEAELTLEAMNGLAIVLGRLNKLDEAATLQQRTVDILRKTKGPENPATLTVMNNQAVAFQQLGRLKEAEPLLREVVQARIKALPDHPGTLVNISWRCRFCASSCSASPSQATETRCSIAKLAGRWPTEPDQHDDRVLRDSPDCEGEVLI